MKTYLNDLFDQMDNEEGNKLDDKVQIEENDLEFNYLIEVLNEMILMKDEQERMTYLLKKTDKYTSKQITKFSLLLNDEHMEKFEDFEIAELLDFLIEGSDDRTHKIYTSHLGHKLNDLFCELTNKVVHIHGDVGSYVGYKISDSKIIVNGNAQYNTGCKMRSGEILVKGNCEVAVGSNMINGLIEVEGNCDDRVAVGMCGGKIIIRGNAGYCAGAHMQEGIVKIYGDIASLSKDIYGGEIYHKDKLIVKNGKLLDRSYKLM